MTEKIETVIKTTQRAHIFGKGYLANNDMTRKIIRKKNTRQSTN